MAGNPLREFFRQRSAQRGDERQIALPVSNGFELQPPFTYQLLRFRDESTLLHAILSNPHPTTHYADSSLFSLQRMNLVRQLLIATRLKIIPEVRSELADLERRSDLLSDSLFPGGQLNPLLEIDHCTAIREYAYVASKYANLLHFRRRAIERAVRLFIESNGRPPIGGERSRILQNALKDGFSWRTLRLSNRGDDRRRYTDEVLSTVALLTSIATGRDSVVLTADGDLFDQFYQLSVIVHDDYGSYLIGQDFQRNPARYPHQHALGASQFLRDGALAIGRPTVAEYLLPVVHRTFAVWIVDVGRLDCLIWIGLREMDAALSFQEHTRDGRVGDGGNGRSVHISLPAAACRGVSAHFAVGEDESFLEVPTDVGLLRFTRFDIMRAIQDRPIHKPEGKIVMRGLPRF